MNDVHVHRIGGGYRGRPRKDRTDIEPTLGWGCECGSCRTSVVETRRGEGTVLRRRRCDICLTETVTREVQAENADLLLARKFKRADEA